MTETRIRWSDAPETVEVIGWVGTMASHVFTIWPPEEDGENGGEYLLTGRLPDHHGTRFYGTRDELKAEAGRWLERLRAGGDEPTGPEIVAVRAELERLRFGPRATWTAPEAVFRRARGVVKAQRRARISRP